MHRTIIFVIFWVNFYFCCGQDPIIELRGGSLLGVSLYSSRRTLVYGFLGVPYARPPTGQLRFRPPERHPGWNRTLQATRFGPACPQPGSLQSSTSEDCLTLNIWIPEYPVGFRPYPVVIFLEGELFQYGNPARFPAEDLTTEGIIVVSVNYRLNVLGFLCLESVLSPGNMGLLDQYLAIRWVRDNIDRFGGDLNRVTLMGHSAGAASASLHQLSPRTQGMFQQVILMSGNALSPWAISRRPRAAALSFARDLNCLFEETDAIMDCLRNREIDLIMRALEKGYRVGNSTELFLPVIDLFLPDGFQYLPHDPEESFPKGDYIHLPTMSGVNSHDGLLFLYQTPEILHSSIGLLKSFFENSAIPLAMAQSKLDANWFTLQEILKFVFVEEATDGRHTLVEQLIDFYTEAYFVAPHGRYLQALAQTSSTPYAYAFGYRGPDIYAGTLNVTGEQFSGAPHGSLLLYIFGPVVYRFLLQRDFSSFELELSDRIKKQWVSFVQNGDPTPSPYGLRWNTYSTHDPYFYIMDEDRLQRGYLPYRSNFWNNFLPRINKLSVFSPQPDSSQVYPGYSTAGYFQETNSEPYRSLFFALLAMVLVILICAALTWACLRKKRKGKQETKETTNVRPVTRPSSTEQGK